MITREKQTGSSSGRTSNRSAGKSQQRPSHRNMQSDSSGSSCDVLLEHSYCISAAASPSPGEEETNGCIGEQVLGDEQLAVIDHIEEQDQHNAPDGQQQQAIDVTCSARSRRARRVPAKYMTDDKLFDDIAEFPDPVLVCDAAPAASSSNSSNKKAGTEHKYQQTAHKNDNSAEKSVADDEEEENDEDEDEEDDDDEDPYKEYCICRKPHANRFMIACDHCEDWFHGSCIGLTKKQAEMYESWVCQTCRDNDPALAHVLKESATKVKPGGEAKKPPQRTVSQTQSSSSSDSGDEKPLRIAPRSPAKVQAARRRTTSTRQKGKEKNGQLEEYEKEDEKEKQRLREVIEKAKREHAEKLKRRERRQGPVDPTMNQLFQVSEPATPTLKSPTKTSPPDLNHRQRIRCMICRSQRVNSDKTVYCSLDCIKHHVKKTKKKKHAEAPAPEGQSPAEPVPVIAIPVFDAFDPADVLESKRKKEDVVEKELVHFLIRNPGYVLDPSIKVKISSRKPSLEGFDSRKSSVSDGGKTPTTPAATTPSHPLGKKKSTGEVEPTPEAIGGHKQRDSHSDDKAVASSTPAGKEKKEKGRNEDIHMQSVRERASKAFLEALEKRLSESDDLDDAERTRRKGMTAKLAKDIEKSLFQLFQTDGRHVLNEAALKNYLAKYRSLIFNLNNSKNQHLLESLFSPTESEKHISPHDVVRMNPEELARGSDLDAWRKIEAKKSLMNSVIVSEEASDGPKLKKTRKGEEEIQNDAGTSEENFARTPDAESGKDKEEALNPLEMILKDIKSSSKTSNKRDDFEEVPRSPIRDTASAATSSRPRRISEAVHSPPDGPFSPEKGKRKKSFAATDEDPSKSSRAEVKRVKIAPEITSILSTSLPDAAEAGSESLAADFRGCSERKILWEGFCSGFEDPNASSSFNPAMNSGSRFPVVCRALVADPDTDVEKLPLPQSLNVVGRIAPEQVSSYVQKILQSTADPAVSESIVELIPLTLKHKHTHLFPHLDASGDFNDFSCDNDDDDDEALLFRENFNKFINYLIQRKRYAVVDVKSAVQSKKSNLKDVYLLPFSIPVTGEAAMVARSSQLPSKMMADLFDTSPFLQEVRDLKPKKPIAILLMLLIKKATTAPTSSSTRERSGSLSSTSTSSSARSSSNQRRLSTRPSRDSRMPEERSFTPPPTSAPVSLPAYIPTPINRIPSVPGTSVPAASSDAVEEEEYAPGSYIPGLSPDRNSSPQAVSNSSRGRHDEDELRQKALIQMRLLHSS